MPNSFPTWNTNVEPNESNIKMWMDNFYARYEPIEQARWNQANIDTLFYAGEQRFINSYFNFNPQYSFNEFHFNLIQQPVNMVTGYQRQHRKSVNYTPIEGSDQQDADDLTALVTYANNNRNLLEKLSRAYELSAISGMVLIQPYLDYTEDPINGTLDLRIWAYNEFFMSPFWREPDLSDCDTIWCQQYVSKNQAKKYFPTREREIEQMSGLGGREGKFYFLPENRNLSRNEMLVMSNVWYQSTRRKKLLYEKKTGLTYDYVEKSKEVIDILQMDTDKLFEVIEVEVPTWKLAVVLNETCMYLGKNPLNFDSCPLIPVFWNYDSNIAQWDLRSRSLVRPMRSAQFLLNRRIILNHDISESSINTGWKRKENAIVNEEDLRYSGQGRDIVVKDGYDMTDIEKIIPNAVPPSDMELATQLGDLLFQVSGVNQELMGMASDAKAGITEILRQGAGLVTLQKYFDQWDVVLKLFGKLEQQIIQRQWSTSKMMRILGREPSPALQLQIFSKFDALVSEGLNTTIQQQQQFAQMLELNEVMGGIIPPTFILKYATIQGKNEIIQAVEQQMQAQQQAQQEQMMLEKNVLDAQMQNLTARSVADLALSRERHGRAESNIGLFEERLSEITKNRSSAMKDRMEALEKLVSTASQYGDVLTDKYEEELEELNEEQTADEDEEKVEAKVTSEANTFITNFLKNNLSSNTMEETQPLGNEEEL